ncbi:MAG: hypothetical protein V3V08_13235 [Nannocystaceae bacterium]
MLVRVGELYLVLRVTQNLAAFDRQHHRHRVVPPPREDFGELGVERSGGKRGFSGRGLAGGRVGGRRRGWVGGD